jgi:response regulator NasT
MGALGYLVKPLDVRQIVPAVRAALSRASERRGAPVVTAEPEPAPVATHVSHERDECIAAGILMERLRIDFDRAVAALQLQAQAENKGVAELAASMVEAANRLNSIRR